MDKIKTNGKHDKHTCEPPDDTEKHIYMGVGLMGNQVSCVGMTFVCEYCHTPQFRRVNV